MSETKNTSQAETSYTHNVITREERVAYIVDVLQTAHILKDDARSYINGLASLNRLRINPKQDEIDEAIHNLYNKLTENDKEYIVALLNKQFAHLESEGLSATANAVYITMQKVENLI